MSEPSAPAAGEEPEDESDPWPARCEHLAVALVVVVVVVLAGGIMQGIAFQPGPPITFVARLRVASLVLGPFDGVLLLVAGVLVALDGITSGERRGPSTAAGRIALGSVVVVSVLVVVASGARIVDLMTGHLTPLPSLHAPIAQRLASALNQVASVLAAVAAAWFALRTLEDGDLAWAFGRLGVDRAEVSEEPNRPDE